jgi:S-DNA-T family DNA segregation ATPase FtsK/SpoIIIE
MGRKRKIPKDVREDEIDPEETKPNPISSVKRSAAAIILLTLAVLTVLGFFGSGGAVGKYLNKFFAYAIGWTKWIFPIFLVISALVLFLKKRTFFYVMKLSGLAIGLFSLAGLFHWFFPDDKILSVAAAGKGGGYAGFAVSFILEKYLGNSGSLVVILAAFFIGMIMAFNFSVSEIFSKLKKGKENFSEENSDEKTIPENKDTVKEENKTVAKPEQKSEEEIIKEMELAAEKNIKNLEFIDGKDQYASSETQYGLLEDSLLEEKNNSGSFRSVDSGQAGQAEFASRRRRKSGWILPPLELLEKSFGSAQSGNIENNFSIIEKTLKDFGIEVERGEAKVGPTVTQYSFRPAVGVKISQILALQNDLSLALAAAIRIEAPIPGQSFIGIEVPNERPLVVKLRNILENSQFKKKGESGLMLALGQDVSGNCEVRDLSKMPHLMIAGATGTGKSVCINSIITTLLYQNSPEDLKLILIDPKRVELSLYNGIPHLLTDTVVENGKVVNVLQWTVGEMERRYKLFQEIGSRDITSYREKIRLGEKLKRTDPESGEIVEEELKKLPFIVVVIDELADLMASHGKEVEGAIVRIAQMARAVGIHLIVSTQRPSVEVITGLIKANITTRIAFQVATQIDSRTILDRGGAEKLLGNGDMLFVSATSSKLKRLQGAFIGEKAVKKVVEFIISQNKRREKKEEKIEIKEEQKHILEFKKTETDENDDELLEVAQKEILHFKKASASFLQRRLRVGYSRAARILDILEEKGIVGPSQGAKPREIYGTEEEINYEDKAEDQEERDKWEL